MDDASVLQIREGLKIVSRQIDELIGILERLSLKHRDTLVCLLYVRLETHV